MKASLNIRSRRRALTAAALLALPGLASAQTALYQWDFDAANGNNTGSGTGGTLSTVGTATFTGSGVTGIAGDNALTVSNAYTGGTGSGNSARNVSGLNVGTLSKFTVTLWVNLTTGDMTNFGRLVEIGSNTNPDNNAGSLAMLMSNGQIQLGVNGTTSTSTGLTNFTSNTGNWVFLAFAYDGTSSTAYNSSSMSGAGFASTNDAALMFGTTTTSATTIFNPGIATAASSFQQSPGSIAATATATVYLGNRSDGGRGLTGQIDDVRLYSSILTTTQIEAIRVEGVTAVPEPSTYTAILGGLALVGVALRRRRT